MNTTIKIDKSVTASDLAGFINVLTNNGYSVRFEQKNTLHLMARITDPKTTKAEDTNTTVSTT